MTPSHGEISTSGDDVDPDDVLPLYFRRFIIVLYSFSRVWRAMLASTMDGKISGFGEHRPF
jgi:hypothetical protein